MKEMKAFTVKAHWGLLIRQGIKTCENRCFRVPSGFYLVHASSSLSFSEWCAGTLWVSERFGDRIAFPSFIECREWCGQILCGVRVVEASTETADPWHMAGQLAWALEGPVPCGRGVSAVGKLGVWPVSPDVNHRYLQGVRAMCGRT